jgi:hypothetical protein
VTASGGDSLTYEWQIETTPRAWATLGRMPMALPCGGSAFSLSPFTAETQIGVRACPGISSYSIRCVVSNACGTAASNAATYTVCAADFNCDGLANSQDFFDFDGAFFAGDPAADFNGDGVINSQDFFDYLSAFFGGC